jgi:6-phosphogluconolactonase
MRMSEPVPVSTLAILDRHCLISFATQGDAVEFVADDIARTLNHAAAMRGQANWLGCGGTSPKPIYERVAATLDPAAKTNLIVLDERFVPLNDARSNETLLRGCFGAEQNVVGLMRDESNIENAALLAEKALKNLGNGAMPVVDFALMGMGADGHYASIFPRHPVNVSIYETTALVMAIAASTQDGIEPEIARLSLTVPAINVAQRIVFYITGEAKLRVLHDMAAIIDPYVSPIGAFLAQAKTPVTFVWAP